MNDKADTWRAHARRNVRAARNTRLESNHERARAVPPPVHGGIEGGVCAATVDSTAGSYPSADETPFPTLPAGGEGDMRAGAGIRGGTLYGTSDKQAAWPADRPVSTADICATIYECLGIDPHRLITDKVGRPVSVAQGGQPLREILI